MNPTTGSATQRAYDFIRAQLQNQELQPGTRLVTRGLAKELGTSLNPVREALNRLASEGLVEHVPGSGTFVHRLDADRIRDLYSARIAIECYAASEAAQKISPAQIAGLRGICSQWSDLANRMQASGQAELPSEYRGTWAKSEEDFYRIFAQASGNTVLAEMVEEKRVLTLMFQSLYPHVVAVTREMVEQVARVRSDLIEAIASGDADAACRNVETMLDASRAVFLQRLTREN